MENLEKTVAAMQEIGKKMQENMDYELTRLRNINNDFSSDFRGSIKEIGNIFMNFGINVQEFKKAVEGQQAYEKQQQVEKQKEKLTDRYRQEKKDFMEKILEIRQAKDLGLIDSAEAKKLAYALGSSLRTVGMDHGKLFYNNATYHKEELEMYLGVCNNFMKKCQDEIDLSNDEKNNGIADE